MSADTKRWGAMLVVSIAVSLGMMGCGGSELEDTEPVEADALGEVESAILGMRVAASLERELIRINNTSTGHHVVARAKNRGLHTIRVAPLPGNTVGYYSNGVITIESPNNSYTFQRLAHELLHAAGYHPHYYPDKGMIGEMCRQANAVCPSWN